MLQRVIPSALIRRRAGLEKVSLNRYRVSVAQTADELEQAFALVQAAYAQKGIASQPGVRLRTTSQHAFQEAVVFIATEGPNVVGTVTATLDSPAKLPLDKDYPEELQQLRRRGFVLAEVNSLAVAREHRGTGVAMLLFMAMHWVVRHGMRADRLVIGVNPSAERLYEAVFSFRRIGSPQPHAELIAPVVGLCQDTAEAERLFRRHYRGMMENGRRVDENFFDRLPDCIDIAPALRMGPEGSAQLSRDVLRALFVERTNQLSILDRDALAHLEAQRSEETMKFLFDKAG